MPEPTAVAGAAAGSKPLPPPRHVFRHFDSLTTRWLDNDIYGHVNNAVYYAFFDSAVNALLIRAGALDIHAGRVIGLVAQSHCDYFAPLAFPQTVQAGVRVARIGRSSVHYEIALFADAAPVAAALGRFVHVYVDRDSRRPVALPPRLLALVTELQGGPAAATTNPESAATP